MDTDVTRNVVVFRLKRGRAAVANAPTQADDSVRQAWATVEQETGARPKDVLELHSEWQPSAADAEFIATTFRKARFTFNFTRPDEDGWEAAFAEARQIVERAGDDEASRRMDQVDHDGELLPVLWSNASAKRQMLDLLPHLPIVPGRVFVSVATVAPTPRGTIGMNHITHGGLAGRSFDDLVTQAAVNLADGLQIDGHRDPERPERGHLLVMRRDGPFAASALALPNFHERLAGLIGQDRFLVGVPEPDTLLATADNSGWVDELRRAVLESPCPPSEMVPTLLAVDAKGVTVVAERV